MKIDENVQQYSTKFSSFEEKHTKIQNYQKEQLEKLGEYVSEITEENFWSIFPYILRIDSKLVLLEELYSTIEEFKVTEKEVIEWVEKDYLCYNKEQCGYLLNALSSHSMIFNVK